MKFYGEIGFVKTDETAPGVWSETVIRRHYYGDILSFTKRYDNSQQLNDNININNRISIVADAFAYENFIFMKFIDFMNTLWKIESVEVQHPRLILSIGGVYNAPEGS